MIEGHQRITCVFVVGCNNIEIRTCEVVKLSYETRVAEIGFTTCCFGDANKVLRTWLLALPPFKENDIVIHDGNKGVMSILQDIRKPMHMYEKEEIDDNWLVDDVYYTAELGRWSPPNKIWEIGK
jgi:hypothetical protein